MYYYNKKSKDKIIHVAECFHIRNTDLNYVGVFESISEAYRQGYRFCKHCNPITKIYKTEKNEITEYCQKHSLSVFCCDRFLSITSRGGTWKIVLNNDANIILYHKNTFKTERDYLSKIAGYHLQKDIFLPTVIEYLIYIYKHDNFRVSHPTHIPRSKVPSPPRKGSRRYNHIQKKLAESVRQQAIENVLNLIDTLRTPAHQIRAMAV